MSERLPAGVEHHDFGDGPALATTGAPEYGERTDGAWRRWNPNRSKLGATLEKGLETRLSGGDSVLYLGAANGTTVSHVADFAGPTYAVEFAPRSARDLLDVCESRPNLFPLLKDARKPETYAHVVETDLDCIVQDVATRGQARVAAENARFLADDGRLVAAIKARSEDVTADPEDVFDDVLAELRESYRIEGRARLEPYHDDHLAVVASPRR
ncbi:fibrillarin-like rRNA/tRNA 2'-O-methyltransferase [Halarchaeum sp. CBA1220]|uniref:fibrillarin-like rRNA/tRNA 2'-O-methyltransferase n=1 Tax=Halarchaeum sp. CBA1220 TaxID=1853682 RepID=UPI000F3A8827|nr:fibrillarin-like rRNA/tRNA 2'-O-methyltransferase [Halarchaeum sp. CBA1220]QLC34608.1 fibrillarin-like rRNA/tRNA 2'-O-methyltransferase [Halarchaeum sp. CBA1220]